jgi:hypothetical protein
MFNKKTFIYYVNTEGEENSTICLRNMKEKMLEQLKEQFADEIENGIIGLVVIERPGYKNELEIMHIGDTLSPAFK